MSGVYFAKAGRCGMADIAQRIPELAPLRQAVVSIFGLGALGAPCALELARAGIGELRILDGDYVDPATSGRWPLGMQSAGLMKVDAIADVIECNYPDTTVKKSLYRLGFVRRGTSCGPSHFEVMREMVEGSSLILDATAEVGVQHYLSDVAVEQKLPYVGVDATPGAWGGHIVRIAPGRAAGCWHCYRHRLMDNSILAAPGLVDDHIQAPGCGDVTFTGAGFDLLQVAVAAVRTTISTICEGKPEGYPACDWDVTTVALRDQEGRMIAPCFTGYQLERHPNCPRCNM